MNTQVVLKTKYASIEQWFASRVEAAIFLKESLLTMDIVSYEVKSVKE